MSAIRHRTLRGPLLACLAAVVALAGCGGGGSAGGDVAVGTSPTPVRAAAGGPPPTSPTDGPLRLVYSSATALWSVGLDNSPRRIAKRNALIGLDVSPDGRTVAFSSEGTGLYIVGVDGRGLRLLDKKGAFEGGQTFSPDGRTVATIRADGVFAMDIDGSGERRLTYDYRDQVQFNPDGRSVAVLRWNVLDSVPVEGGAKTRLLSTERPIGYFAYSPDGRRLVYGLESNDYDSDLFVADADGTNVRRLTTTGDVGVADWSPDGTQLAFHRGGEKGVWMIDADGANLHSLAKRGSYPRFSSDGRHIAISDGAAGLRVVRPDGSAGKAVGRGFIERFAVVPAGSKVSPTSG